MYNFICYIRTWIFYSGYAIGHIILGVIAKFLEWTHASPETCYQILTRFNWFVMWWARVSCGIRFQVQGKENIPSTPCIVLSNHQSAWETYFLGILFRPQSTVLKLELLSIPIFGWVIRLLQPIAIDRSKPASAIKILIREGKKKLQQRRWVLIFPEGTRVRRGETEKFSGGGAALAYSSNTDILPVAHNAGLVWPAGEFVKRPGVVTVVIGEVISAANHSRDELHDLSENWIRSQVEQLMDENVAPIAGASSC